MHKSLVQALNPSLAPQNLKLTARTPRELCNGRNLWTSVDVASAATCCVQGETIRYQANFKPQIESPRPEAINPLPQPQFYQNSARRLCGGSRERHTVRRRHGRDTSGTVLFKDSEVHDVPG